ncbi:MAG: hypothetical protein EXS37_07440 [Opitutus sp.]|nr:hypothetical protein [Opitutus sp.]
MNAVTPRFRRLLSCCVLSWPAFAAESLVRTATRTGEFVLVAPASQPTEYRYTAFPTLLRVGPDAVWVAYKAGRSHATDAGAAIEVVAHTLSTGETKLIQRLPAPPPKLYQMGELTRLPDGTVAIYVDVQAVGWDGRHYRAGAEVFRWNTTRAAFDAPTLLEPVNGVRYGYPLDFISEGKTTWQLIMAFGYMQGGRWSVDALRSDDAGRSWNFVRNLTDGFGGIRANESGFVRHGDGFIVTTRGYDGIERLHRTDGEFRVRHQVVLTGKYPFINSHIGRPRIFGRGGQGYLIGRNRTQPGGKAVTEAGASPMQLCLLRFDLETLAITSCVVLDNAENQNVTDGYYAVTAFSGAGATERFHVITYKAIAGQPPGIVRFDYRWDAVK